MCYYCLGLYFFWRALKNQDMPAPCFILELIHFSAFIKFIANINNFERTEMSKCLTGTCYGHIT